MDSVTDVVNRLFQNVRKVIIGKDEQIKLLLCCWFAGGHILIEDSPGTGKTILARAVSKSVNVDFKRVQFTPDLLPSDILGAAVFNQGKQSFEFIQGPIFTSIFLGDEINRATPRTQSALLESMAEGQVTVEGASHRLNSLFFVVATQNPIEQHGTFPLPEAQLDRFMMKISMGYPKGEEEIRMVKTQNEAHPIHSLNAVETEEHIRAVRNSVSKISIKDSIYTYAVAVIDKTRRSPDLKMGASPRATLALLRAAQSMALLEGSPYVSPSHVYKLFKPVLAHRLVPTPEARLAGKNSEKILEGLIQETAVPVN